MVISELMYVGGAEGLHP